MSNEHHVSDLTAGQGLAPSLVILGAPRCGTTALAKWLDDTGLAIGVKDSFYLMDHGTGLRGPTHLSTHGVSGYLRLFPGGKGRTAECAAGYLYQRTALDFFSEWRVAPQFAVIVRDPVSRLQSVHRYFSGNLGLLPEHMDFTSYAEALFADAIHLPDQTVSCALDQGAYASHLAPWVREFGHDRVHVISFETLKKDPKAVVQDLLDIAGVTAATELQSYGFQSRNASYVRSSPFVDRATDWARRLTPPGRLKSWAGETVRRVHNLRHKGASAVDTTPDHIKRRLSDFYREHNEELRRVHGIDTTRWT